MDTKANADDVRRVLLSSKAWHDLLGKLPVMAIAKLPPMRPEEWSQAERDEVVTWVAGFGPTPGRISDYIDNVKKVA